MHSRGDLHVSDPSRDPTVKEHYKPDSTGAAIRRHSLAELSRLGFTPSDSLPTAAHRKRVPGRVRPAEEIASRLLALATVVKWVTSSPDQVSSELLKRFAARANLRDFMTPTEKVMFGSDRDAAGRAYRDAIGWRMENMWPLAWALGFPMKPTADHGQVGADVMQPIARNFLPHWDADPVPWIKEAKTIRQEKVVQLEDLFYCAHNAVRSAQLGDASKVPKGFHPVLQGGTIHERRHSLTWILSPNVKWQDTDLST